MGLDSFASRAPGTVELTDEDEKAFEEAGIELCGGMFSGDGGSFRGKVYELLVNEVTGNSLYQEWTPPETVGEMATALEACDPQKAAGDQRDMISAEVTALAKFFRLCADRDLGLVGWW